MSDYTRTTRECSNLAGLTPMLAAAIQKYVEKYGPENLEQSILICCETASTKKKKGLFSGKAEVILTGILVMPRWLIWASGKEGETPGVLAARLSEVRVQDYEKSDFHKMLPDCGLNIDNLNTGTLERGSSFIGLGEEPAAQKFRAVLREALQKAIV